MGFISLSLGPARTVLESVTFKCTLQLSFPSGCVCKQPNAPITRLISQLEVPERAKLCAICGFFSRRSLLPPNLSPLTFLSVTSHFSILSSFSLRAFSTHNEGSDAGVWFGAGRMDVCWWWWGDERMTGTSVWIFMQPASTTSWFNSFCQLFCILLIMAATLRQTEGCGGGDDSVFDSASTASANHLKMSWFGLWSVFVLFTPPTPVILLG